MNIKETFNNKRFFIVGVGGSGMSSIAKYLTESGAIVFGYDQRKSLVTNQLLKLGIKVTHDIDFEIEPDTLVITSSAINDENSLNIIPATSDKYSSSLIKNKLLSDATEITISGTYFSSRGTLTINDEQINYIHVVFEWEQEPNAIGYNLQVSNQAQFVNCKPGYITESGNWFYNGKERFGSYLKIVSEIYRECGGRGVTVGGTKRQQAQLIKDTVRFFLVNLVEN